ncbi:hypothetical protein KAR91_40180 [Candidatus Pacearchaeota archaeon]|nr:hypothetical protein [Candidatus Pacearchaeota archaeon]
MKLFLTAITLLLSFELMATEQKFKVDFDRQVEIRTKCLSGYLFVYAYNKYGGIEVKQVWESKDIPVKCKFNNKG